MTIALIFDSSYLFIGIAAVHRTKNFSHWILIFFFNYL